jgi:uncharacterized membrane protein YtjA (UPF0391 family)
MLIWTISFLIVATAAAVLGIGGIAGAATGIAPVLLVLLLILFFTSLLSNSYRRQSKAQ